MSNFISRNIVIEAIESKMASTGNTKYIIKDTNNNKYFFWMKAQGENSSVYESFMGMQPKKGSTVNISFTEKEESFVNKDGKTINYTDRFIGSLREASGIPEEPEKPHHEAKNAPEGKSVDWDKLGYAKTLTNWTAELLGQGTPVEEIKGFIQNEAWELWGAIDVEADRRFNPARVAFNATQKAKEQAELQPEDIDVESIPF